MSKKVCMVVGNHFTNDARVNKEARSLSKAGYSVTVYALAEEGLPVSDKGDGFLIKRLQIKNYFPAHIKFWRIYTQFYPAYKQILEEKADVYHSHDANTLLICFLAARKNNAKLVYDFHEYWRNKTLWRESFFGRVWDALENKILVLSESLASPHVDAFITVNGSLAREFRARNIVEREPVFLYNAPHLTIPNDRDRLILRGKTGVDRGDKLILFLGVLSRHRGLENLIKSLEYLRPDFKLVFLGYGALKENILRAAATKGYKGRIFVLDPVPSEDVVRWASGADVGVSPIQNASWSYYHSSPNKAFEYLMAGLPIATSNFPEMEKIVKENNVGVTFNPEDPKDIARAIKNIFANQEGYRKMRSNALKAAREKYNWEIEERKLIDLYRGFK